MRLLAICLISVAFLSNAPAQNSNRLVEVDPSGIMRWTDSGEALTGFGINYTVPFAHAYRMAGNKGLEVKKLMDQDIHHFTRLGFDLYRVHVWDTEISDTLGNLLENEHLDAFDYLLAELKKRNFRIVLTPIAFWGNGWPEPDYPSPGFSHKYGKDACLTNSDAIQAQERYLDAFVRHVNPYTGIAYKDDPDIVAFEVSNEPHHRGTPTEVTAYINRMARAIRLSGCQKPVFYNMSHSIHLSDAYMDADVQGGTFQWYPTGLLYGKALEGNFLPNVDTYPIPFASAMRKNGKARLVYEFDAANIPDAPMYPAMARTFRTAGIQIGTHFSWDPGFLAYANTEYNTHYMNLAYTPQKAIGLMLAGEVFHRVPLFKDYGHYPHNRNFEGFRLDENTGLAELLADDRFIYTASTQSKPENPEAIRLIAGWGNSPLVQYSGMGAYFLDKIAPSKWRLEVMPDPVIIQNPYGRNSPHRSVALINWAEHQMALQLADLGQNFSIRPLNEGNVFSGSASQGQFSIRPGTYLLLESGKEAGQLPQTIRNIGMADFWAPHQSLDQTLVIHEAPNDGDTANELKITATIVSNEEIAEVYIHNAPGYGWQKLPMERIDAQTFEAFIPAEKLEPGIYDYQIVVKTSEGYVSFPGANPGKPGDWDYATEQTWQVRIQQADAPIYLFDANTDADWVLKQWNKGVTKAPLPEPDRAEFRVAIEQLFRPDAENPEARPVYDYSFQHYIRSHLLARANSLNDKKYLVLEGQSLQDGSQTIQLALTTHDGRAFGTQITLQNGVGEYKISLKELKAVPFVLLPRPYPTFLPYFFDGDTGGSWDWSDIERIQVSAGPGLTAEEQKKPQAFSIISMHLE